MLKKKSKFKCDISLGSVHYFSFFWYFFKCCYLVGFLCYFACAILFGFSFFVRGYFCCFWALRCSWMFCTFTHCKATLGLRQLGRSALSSEKTEADSGKFTPLYWEIFQVNYHEPLAGDEATFLWKYFNWAMMYLASDQWVLAMSHPEHRLLWWAKLKISFHSKAEVWVQK